MIISKQDRWTKVRNINISYLFVLTLNKLQFFNIIFILRNNSQK